MNSADLDHSASTNETPTGWKFDKIAAFTPAEAQNSPSPISKAKQWTASKIQEFVPSFAIADDGLAAKATLAPINAPEFVPSKQSSLQDFDGFLPGNQDQPYDVEVEEATNEEVVYGMNSWGL